MDGKPCIVAVNAISGGGKTAITNKLQKRLPHAQALYFDDRNYDEDSGIEDICAWMENGADVQAFDLQRLADDIENLCRSSLDYILLDYPFGYKHHLIAPYIDLSVFIDTPLDVALARRILRDYDGTSSGRILGDMEHYLSRGRDAYLYGLDETRKCADLVVDGSKCVDEIVDAIMEKIDEWRNQYA